MQKITFLVVVSLFFISQSFSQSAKIIVGTGHNDFKLIENRSNEFVGVLNISKIQSFTVATKKGNFTQLFSEHMVKNFNQIGNPDLPVFNQMIEIPEGATVSVKVLSYDEKIINLADYGIQNKIIPTQPSIRKNQDPSKVPFVYNKQAYQVNSFRKAQVASVTKLGKVHGKTIGRLTFNPIDYNPITNTLKVKTNLVVKVSFEHIDYSQMEENAKRFYSPYFEGMFRSTLINHKKMALRDTMTKYPIKMVIVADPMFKETLQPYIKWKTKKGFHIVEAYTDNSQVGNTTTSIHNYLKDLYNSATASDPAPTFVLFVGDINEIPAYSSSESGYDHYTDLYYSCFDDSNDIYPEMYYGRFSADNVSQLQVYIDKTLEIEQYTMPDPSYLGRCVMVAGVDDNNAPTYANGQISYGCNNYFNTAHGYTDVYEYLYGSGTPITSDDAGAADSIHKNVSDGVGFANYTAHCSPDGWANPSFTQSDISNLQNNHKYGFMIGNCCQSNKFDEEDAFGEVITYTPNKGCYAYCGGTQYTYWDEDFWWGVGATDVSSNPSYDEHLGAYDRAWHDNGEAKSDWYVTTYQTAFAGDMAVTEAGSSLETYYWEIYSISGDPSIMPYYAVPTSLSVSYDSPQPVGISSLQVNTEEDAYVAISLHGVLLDAQIADASGQVTLTFPAINDIDTADIVVTKQNKQPYIGTLITISSNIPYIVYDSYTIHDDTGNDNGLADYSEDITLDMTLKNIGHTDDDSITTTISTTNPYITITDDTAYFGFIAGDSNTSVSNAYAFHIADSIPDQEWVTFNLQASDTDTTWNSIFKVMLQAPELQVTTISIDDASGNNNGRLDPGETVNLTFNTINNGHSVSPVATGILTSSSSNITINDSSLSLGTINTTTPVPASFSVDISPEAQTGSIVDFYYQTNANSYAADKRISLPIGLIVEDWETGDFSQFNWLTSGAQPWFIDNSTYYEGTNSSRSGHITDDQSSVMEIDVNVVLADTLSFFKKVSCESSPYSSDGYWYDYLKFEIDGNVKGQWDGNVDWSREAYYLTTGKHTLKWTYYKDESSAEGADAAWVDFIAFPVIDSSMIIHEYNVDNTSLNIYPNPASDYVNIHYVLKEKSDVTIKLYNINGQQIATLLNKTNRNQGEYSQMMMTNNLQSGVYYIKADMDNTTFVKRLIIQ